MARVATGPSKASFQCLYRLGSVRKSTIVVTVSSAMRGVSLAQDHPERLGAPGSEILPAVRRPSVEIGAVARLETLDVAIVVEGYPALQHVEELHLPRGDDDLVGLDAFGSRSERGDDGADLPLEESRPQHMPFLRGAVEGHHRVLTLPAHVEPTIGGGLEELADRDAESAGQLAQGGQRRGEPRRLDLRDHGWRQPRLLRELSLLEAALASERLDARAEGSHLSSPCLSAC